jgi:hypothetical protein
LKKKKNIESKIEPRKLNLKNKSNIPHPSSLYGIYKLVDPFLDY